LAGVADRRTDRHRGLALVGTRYKHFTLEIDNRIESPSVNFQGWIAGRFFEIALAFARMLNEPESNWTPDRLLHYIELDRYRGGECTGEYLSRLHYLEDWLYDNDRRGLVEDLTRSLGGVSVPHSAREMSVGWRHYRYLAQIVRCSDRWRGWKRTFLRAHSTKFQKAGWPKSNRNCAAATSSELSGVNDPGFTRHRTLASRSGRKMAVTFPARFFAE